MKLDRFIDKLMEQYPDGREHDETEVVLRTANVSVGGVSGTEIGTVYHGIDWDRNKCILMPQKPVIFLVHAGKDEMRAAGDEWAMRLKRGSIVYKDMDRPTLARQMFIEGAKWATMKIIDKRAVEEVDESCLKATLPGDQL